MKIIKKKKEFTITLDVAVFADSKEAAVRKLGKHLANGKFQYWLGDVTEERSLQYASL